MGNFFMSLWCSWYVCWFYWIMGCPIWYACLRHDEVRSQSACYGWTNWCNYWCSINELGIRKTRFDKKTLCISSYCTIYKLDDFCAHERETAILYVNDLV